MSHQVNFNTHGKELNDAYQAVISEKEDTNWLIYAFDKGTYDLRVQATGEDGLEELNDEFSDGKVQFALAKVIDPNTELPKLVFIGWCGSGVPELRKAFFSAQFNDVSKFFKSFHVQINARDEADVDPNLIMKRVAESSGANYSVHKETAKAQSRVTPVNSVYKKTEIPDIAAMQRQSMTKENAPTPVGTNYKPVQTAPKKIAEQRWNQQVTSSNNDGANAVRAEREEFERQVREREMERSKQVISSNTPPPPPPPPATPSRPIHPPSTPTRPKEDMAAKRAAAAREQEAIARQQAQEEEERRRRYEEEEEQQRQQQQQEEEEAAAAAAARQQQEEEEEQRRYEQEQYRLQQEEVERKRQQQQQEEEEEEAERQRQQDQQAANLQSQLDETANRAIHAAAGSASAVTAATTTSHLQGVSAVVLFAYEASETNEMTLFEGEVVHQIDQVDEGWWFGVSEDGSKQGLFPANYVQILEQAPELPTTVASPPAPPVTLPVAPSVLQTESVVHDEGNVAVALYDYQAEEENEISFNEGDVITKIEFVSDDWWQGSVANGTMGLFPANYVELKQ